MKKFVKLCGSIEELLGTPYKDEMKIDEAIDPKLQMVLDSKTTPTKDKLTRVTSMVRGAIKRGEDTGLDEDKPKKGSSRAVFFPKGNHKYTLDGKEAESPSVVKIAFPGQLDKYNKSGRLLGEHQNAEENSHFTNHNYGIISEHAPGKYKTNLEHGVLAPHFGSSDDHDDYVHQGRVSKFNASEFKEATKTKEFPKGITHNEFHAALMQHHADANGRTNYDTKGLSKERIEKVQEHPFVEKVQDYIANTGAHPADLAGRNLGMFTHPHTGVKHPVISDYGYTESVAKEYQNARMNQRKSNGF